ncbi:MAG: CGNR zinc finger domain-containing protein [Gemmatimonadota bacterium]
MAGPVFLFLGEALWLDLANTAPQFHTATEQLDVLPDADLARAWLLAAGLPGLDHRTDPASLFTLRTEFIRLADALATGARPPTSSISAINGVLRGTAGRELLTRTAGSWRLRFLPMAPAGALEALARSAAVTLADPLGQVRRCAEVSCQRLFVDATPHQTRAWCREQCHASTAVERRRIHRPIATA